MWALRFLNGPQAGHIVQLKTGSNRLGRGADCEIKVLAAGVSKEHLEIVVAADKILINDLGSSNGTFLNGVRIKGALCRPGDKIGVYQVLAEVIPFQTGVGLLVPQTQRHPVARMSHAPPAVQGSMASAPIYKRNSQEQVQEAFRKGEDFVEQVALPGVYRLPEIFELKQVLMVFIGIYILIVTLLSVVPMKIITHESIQNESFRRALTVARSLAASNERSIRSNDLNSYSVDQIFREEGIDDVYITSKEGTILAPPERTGGIPREAGFVRKIRGIPKEFTEEVDGKILAAVPVVIFDPEIQQNTAKAHVVVVYNPGSLAFDDGRAFSLFVQMLFLAFLIGTVLFFFLYKLIERPFSLLNRELDLALREGRDQAVVSFRLPVLQNLMTNINSLLARAAQGAPTESPQNYGRQNRDQEMQNILSLIGYPAVLIAADYAIRRVNSGFETLTGMTEDRLLGLPVSEIPDGALQQNFTHLMNQAKIQSQQIHADSLEFSGHQFSLNCQGILNGLGEVEFYLIVITPVESVEGGAA